MSGVSVAIDFPGAEMAGVPAATVIDVPEDEIKADEGPPEVPVALRALHAKENKLMTQKTERAVQCSATLDMMIDRIRGDALRSAAVRLWKEAHEHWPMSIGDSPAALHAFAYGDGKTFRGDELI